MARTRTTKRLAQRIDLNYFKRPTTLKRAKLWLSVGIPALAVVWIAAHGLARDSRVYSSGRMSEPHAVLENECAACHVPTAGAFSAKASDSACLSCHDGPMHHAGAVTAPGCASCHAEHRDRVDLKAVKSENCAQCHADLETIGVPAKFAAHVSSFEGAHPEFAALRDNARDAGTIRVNHALHMKPIRSGPNGPDVQLECGDCHRTEAASSQSAWKYADAKSVGGAASYSATDELLPVAAGSLASYRPSLGSELMAPAKFATACAGCHSLAFDRRFSEGVPHDKPEVVHAFLVKKFSGYVSTHPGELREVREPGRDLTGKTPSASVRVYTSNEWVAARIYDAEQLLWRKTCKQCHALTFGLRQDTLPIVEPARTTVRWMPHAKFSHDAHRGFSCVSCHEKVMKSTETADLLVPGIATCRTCHARGADHADSQCSECHTYHDWSKRKEVNSTFTLPVLRTGGGK